MWVLGGLLVLWNGLAVFDYLMTVIRFEPYLAGFPEEALAYYFSLPKWMFVMFGIGSFGGLISAVLMLMRRRVAVLVAGVSWICSLIAAIYTFANPVPGGGNNIFLAVVLLISLLIVFYMYWLQKRGILR